MILNKARVQVQVTQDASLPSQQIAEQRDVAVVAFDRAPTDRDRRIDTLFRQHYASVVNYLISQGLSRDEAEDVAQEIFISLWQAMLFLPDDSALVARLFRQAYYSALGYWRRVRRRDRLFEKFGHAITHSPSQPDDITHSKIVIEKVIELIPRLPKRCRLAYYLRRFHGLSYKKIGELMNIDWRTVESHVKLGHRKMVELLGGERN